MVVDPMTVGLTLAALVVVWGIFAAGYLAARRPDNIIDVSEVANYYRYHSGNEALRQDVSDEE